ncbi:MAG: response regulator, partial [Anaerovibrio sp.]|nr:response regulator [Anaerovibrio sp.]
LVHKFINLLGGTIEVKSQLNEGTVFDFQIPIKISWDSTADNESMPQINAVEKPSVAKDILKDVPVLLVEDNEINAELTKLIITDYGANIIDWAHNGQEALEMYSASEPSHYRLIIMDLRMPVMDGLTATRKIRRLHRVDASIVPIIAISADAYAEDIQNCIEAGMQCHISKPIDVDKLMAAINDLI